MKKKVLAKIKKAIKKQYPNYDNDKIDEIMYGLEGIYLTITKTIIIFAIAFILEIQKELLILLLSFNFIRLFAFGMHANNSITCLIFSSSLFLGGAALIKFVDINSYLYKKLRNKKADMKTYLLPTAELIIFSCI